MDNDDITRLGVQRKNKPMIEDVIPEYLVGEYKVMALEFSSYLRESRIKPVWATHNAWKATYKGKVICYIRLPRDESDFSWLRSKQPRDSDWKQSWIVTPHLYNMEAYEGQIVREGLQGLIWDNLSYCGHCDPLRKCAPGLDKIILNKKIKGLCRGSSYDGYAVWIGNPDESAIGGIKKLLELEKKARAESSI